MTATLSIVIPVYNEEATLRELLDRVVAAELPIGREIIVVNDGSADASPEIARAWAAEHSDERVVLIDQENGGKGAAVRAGIRASTGDIVIIQDADLEYDPREYVACIAPILAGEAKVVYGSRQRFAANHMHSSWAFYVGGMLVSAWFSALYQTWLTDEPTCYKTFDGELIRALLFEGDGFEWEPEITAKLLRLGFEIKEVPISYTPRKLDAGKKIRASDGFRALWEGLRWRFKSIEGEREKLAALDDSDE